MGMLNEPLVAAGGWVKVSPAEVTEQRRYAERLLGVRLDQVRDVEAKRYAEAGLTPPADLLDSQSA